MRTFAACFLVLPFAGWAVGACSATDTGGGTSDQSSASSTSTGQGGENTGGSSGTGGAGGDVTGGGGGPVGCLTNADCTTDPARPLCDVVTGKCVGCLVANDTCLPQQYCNGATGLCAPGCNDNSDCDPANGLVCNTSNHTCVGCLTDASCPPGTICISSTCVAGCTPSQACQVGFSCCGTSCVDLATDEAHCGSCSNPCPDLDNAQTQCVNSQCLLGTCDGAYADCNGDVADGCEWNTLQDGPCLCNAGDTQSCYQGIPGSLGVGPCVAGTQTCDPTGTFWGPCTGQVLPVSEVCGNLVDDDCDGTVDNGGDIDGDGWTSCQGDCCDVPGPNCQTPSLVNPGAFEVVGNGQDDDCNPATSDVVAPAPCSAVQQFATVTATDVAHAMDICQNTTASPLLPQQKTWGLISAQQLYANGSVPGNMSNIQNFQTAILTDYGTGVFPQVGATMAGISTGRMRDQLDAGWQNPSGGSLGATGTPPAAYLAANGGALPSPGINCLTGQPCVAGTGANDSVNIKLTMRVPTNAQSFSYQFKFYSAEFPEFKCTSFNDFYLALLTSAAAGLPPDKNISFDSLGNVVSVNSGFFDVCAPSQCNTCPDGVAELACTGMQGGVLPACGNPPALPTDGGGSKWLTTDAPIVPGETITLEFMVFDVSDNVYDSLSLLDNFHWNLSPAAVSTHQ